jgi:hypothetical protein
MAKMLADGNVKVTYVVTIANLAAPDVSSELTAGSSVALECLITADGFNISVDEAVVSLPALCETFDAESPGRAKYAIDLTCFRHIATVDDKAWTTLLRGLSGYLVVRYGVAVTTAYTAADKLIVFPVTFGERKPLPTEANGGVKFSSHAYVTSQPQLDAVAVA